MATYTDSTAKKFIKPNYIVVTEWQASDTTEATGDVYVLEDVIEDTTTLSQDDNDTTDIECETSDNPIISITKLGKYQLGAEVADTQSDLLKVLAGFTIDGDYSYAPSSYEKKYVKFDIVFINDDGETYYAFTCPKVQLNSKMLIESLNSNTARIALGGTAQNVSVTTSGGATISTAFYTQDNYEVPAASAE